MIPLAVGNAKNVTFKQYRWTLRIDVELQDGTVETHYASADGGLTRGDGIWFGTQEEWDEDRA